MHDDASYAIVNGLWLPLSNRGTVSLKEPDVATYSVSLTGRNRVLSPADVDPARQWDVRCDDVPAEWADTRAVLRRLYRTKQVFQWVPPAAIYHNLLESHWENGKPELYKLVGSTPGITTSGGLAAYSGKAPVRGGQIYTASVFSDGQATMRLYFYNAANMPVANTVANNKDGYRLYLTGKAPVTAVTARIWVSDASSVASPAISESEELHDYDEPGTCPAAIVSDFTASHDDFFKSDTTATYSFTVMEVS